MPSGQSLTQDLSQLIDEIAAGAQSPSAVAIQAPTGVPSLTSQLTDEMAGGAGTPTDTYSHDELIDETVVVERTPTVVSSLDDLIDETAVQYTTTEVDSDSTLTPTEVYSHEPAPAEVYSHEPMPTPEGPEVQKRKSRRESPTQRGSPEGSNSRQ